MDPLDFLDTSEKTPETTPVTETVPVATDTTPEGGSALTEETPKVVETAPKVEETPAPVVTASTPATTDTPVVEENKEPKYVPLKTFLDKVEEAAALKAQLKEKEKTPEPVDGVDEFGMSVPDPVKNPKEYADYAEVRLSMNLMNERMNNSERFARQAHGNEVMDKVKTWALDQMSKDQAFGERVVGDPDPYEAAKKAYDEHMELEDYRTWVRNGRKPEEAPGVKPAPVVSEPIKPVVVVQQAPTKQQPAVEKIPDTIVDEVSHGGPQKVPVGPGQSFDSVFGSGD